MNSGRFVNPVTTKSNIQKYIIFISQWIWRFVDDSILIDYYYYIIPVLCGVVDIDINVVLLIRWAVNQNKFNSHHIECDIRFIFLFFFFFWHCFRMPHAHIYWITTKYKKKNERNIWICIPFQSLFLPTCHIYTPHILFDG